MVDAGIELVEVLSARPSWRASCANPGKNLPNIQSREMPARWYELLRERMQVEQPRMRIVKHGYLSCKNF